MIIKRVKGFRHSFLFFNTYSIWLHGICGDRTPFLLNPYNFIKLDDLNKADKL